ncbi:MAG TPA: DNA repair protein RadC [Candidatus Egerieimonas intestinavium]|uniref:DNA repair protein RadC n=1 Tax=Candidatus Egerieimonas intestinavium TaxID=2840777 RepID=A0A9D1ELN3_9FIRM|nr:DNA repair protein RadC [Candidatus Egerieimonas intestinavium]
MKNQDWNTDRPYEKCLAKGPAALTDAELLAVIIRTGAQGISSVKLAEQILQLSKDESGLLGLHHLSLQELTQLKGVGKVKAIQLKCLGELSIRIAQTSARKKLAFTEPQSIAEYYMEKLRHEEQEQMVCMFLNTRNQLLGEKILSKGTVNSSVVSPRELFLAALQFHAVCLILVHNHPSGDATPSREDVLLTKRIQAAGELLGITLLDHIVIGDHQYVSLRQQGVLAER